MAAKGGNLTATLAQAARRLSETLGLDAREARLEARVLAAHALGVDRAWLIAHDRDGLDPARAGALELVLARRLAGEPVAYLLEAREFYSRAFALTPDVLIPRPETEHLVEAALADLPADQPIRVLDVGTGSGAIAVTLALERRRWRVCGVDVSPAALAVARGNALRLGARVDFRDSDVFSGLAGQRFQLIVSNPPYVAAADAHLDRGDPRFEPRLALVGGVDGLDVIRRLVAEAPAHLDPDGWLLLEHGWDQAAPIAALLAAAGFTRLRTLPDLAGVSRVSGGVLGGTLGGEFAGVLSRS